MALLNGLTLQTSTNLILPQHVVAGSLGAIRINSSTTALEIHDGTTWEVIRYLNGAASGGTETTSGSYTVNTFTADGTLTVTGGGIYAELLLVGGGGGGGGNGSTGDRAGAGGAGGLVFIQNTFLPSGSYTATVGTGGTGLYGALSVGNGTPSILYSSSITFSASGGGGGAIYGSNTQNSCGSGGGGGGGSYGAPTNYISGQGNVGGGGSGTFLGSGGGAGGAGVVGGTHEGGVGRNINGVWYAGGGGGGQAAGYGGAGGSGGNGGGGNGSYGGAGGNGTANTGGGGGIGGWGAGGNGGSGIIIIRYLT